MSESNEDTVSDRPLFESLTSILRGDVVAQTNRLMEEMDGRTPYGQLGTDGILRSTRNEYASTDDTGSATTPFQPATSTVRKRSIGKVKVAEKVLPSGDIVTSHPGTGAESETTHVKANVKRRKKRTGRGAAELSTLQRDDTIEWFEADEADPDFLRSLRECQKEKEKKE